MTCKRMEMVGKPRCNQAVQMHSEASMRSLSVLFPLSLVWMLAVTHPNLAAAQDYPKKEADASRIDELLERMSLEEKMNLIRGGVEDNTVYQGQAGYLPGVP